MTVYLTLINTTRVAHDVFIALLLDLLTCVLRLMFNTTLNLPWSDMRRRFLLCERDGERHISRVRRVKKQEKPYQKSVARARGVRRDARPESRRLLQRTRAERFCAFLYFVIRRESFSTGYREGQGA